MLDRVKRASLALPLLVLWACASSAGTEHKYETPTYTKPGASLSKVACSCLACVSMDACYGMAPPGKEELGCEDGFRMEQTTRFEANVKPCKPSCFRRSWSVGTHQRCLDKRPEDCCPDY